MVRVMPGVPDRDNQEEEGAAVEALMKADPPLTQEAWHRLRGWYKATADRPHHPLELRSGG